MKELNFEYNGIEYCLTYTRNSIRQMGGQGFNVQDIQSKPMSCLPALFAGAFIAKHKFTKGKLIEEIFDLMDNKMELIGVLAEMYNAPIEAMLDNKNDNEKKIAWSTNK